MDPAQARPLAEPWETLHTAVGRILVLNNCPFCQAQVRAYLWSLSGSGKRCDCGAVLTMTGAYLPLRLRSRA